MQVKILCFLFLSFCLNQSKGFLRNFNNTNTINYTTFCKYLSEDRIEPFAPVVIYPTGPITYYNQYESTNSITLNTIYSSGNQWYKNGIVISGATGNKLTIEFYGSLTYTDYYTVTHDTRTSNQVEFNYKGCSSLNEYPVKIPSLPWPCSSSLPVTLNAVNLGAGATYQWWTYENPSSFYFSPSTNTSPSTLIYTNSPNTWNIDGIYTKSSLIDQYGVSHEEVYMYYSFTSQNCAP